MVKQNTLVYYFGKTKVLLENGWNFKRMITEGDAAIQLETTWHAFGNQEKSKQRSAIALSSILSFWDINVCTL